MTPPIPIFRFVFAAYYATSHDPQADDDDILIVADSNSKAPYPALVLVVDNDVMKAAKTLQNGGGLQDRLTT